jgi:hypothetical protein
MKRLAIPFGRFMLFVHSDDPDMAIMLAEAQHRGKPLAGPYSALKHPARVAHSQNHLHVYKKQNQLFALNQDGTAHDCSHRVRIPSEVAVAIRQQYPDWLIPQNNVIECIEKSDQIAMLMEGSSFREIVDPLCFRDWLLLEEGGHER